MVSSCNQEQELSPVNNFEKEISFLSEMNTSGFNLTVSNLGKNITPIDNKGISLNQKQLVKEMLSGLNGHYFNADEKTILDFASNYGALRLPDQLANVRTTGIVDLSSFEIYSESQLDLVQPFIDDILNEDNLQTAKSKAIAFQQKVVNSSLSDDEKFQLFAVSTGVIGFAEFVEDGGVEEINKILVEELGIEGSNARLMGCSINTRSVLADCVVGLVAGAAGGCYAGATAGTVAFPIVGTVTGCVSAGVVAGAGGFLSGIAYGVASQLLTSCFR